MDKRLTRTDYLFAITFIFMLVVALGAFFLGLKMGQERSAVKYEEMLAKQTEAEKGFAAYHQQYLVSFYHTIYQPYREFHKKWFDKMEELQTNSSADASLIMKDLAKLGQETYNGLGSRSMPDSSPLLKEAHMNYMRSLKLFSEASGTYQTKANGITGSELFAQLESDAYLEEAKNYALRAEKEYYESIVKWNQTVNEQFKPIDVTKPIALESWSALGLNMKNEYIAQMMMTSKWFKAFTPQDLTVRIDEMIASGQAKNLNLLEINGIVDVLIATNAVRPGDFLRGKNKYTGETLPQLPFFTN
ncbi:MULTISPECIES: hypothetical protein [unclassified Paenibacillus]|uniref:hypothetical protein n=1 Tax=unclassified Paenibacillus TaxID=185978 RepID=UPI001AE15F4D|nr:MULTISPECIES: hypothetical protein [unclassified Paenibacillus]MBP1155225.1 hypothetical protein [Paenibacillus sp. PvP091]MBP1169391.1 hypothetical protein [Paenibacillus sp. PvR098]MBP2440419.1 hypothetical protein [Paenibacillus sp. PvP052]